MKRFLTSCFAVVALLSVSAPAMADQSTFRAGFGADVGVPSGASLGLVVHPFQDVLVVQASLTYNYLAVGGRLSLKLDPMALKKNLPIGVFIDGQGGFFGQGTIPGHSATVGYDYVNLYGGLRFGKPNGFHWNIEVGPTYLSAQTGNFQSLFTSTSGTSVGNPKVSGWVVPTFVTGFEVVWP